MGTCSSCMWPSEVVQFFYVPTRTSVLMVESGHCILFDWDPVTVNLSLHQGCPWTPINQEKIPRFLVVNQKRKEVEWRGQL